jgi:hypothetical protein
MNEMAQPADQISVNIHKNPGDNLSHRKAEIRVRYEVPEKTTGA